MKIRIKFQKTGSVRFIGHLDVMRYFQKLMRRSEIDIKYSQGYHPHQIMSFAAPLGVGMESLGEYMDIEVATTRSSAESVRALNEQSVPDIQVLSYRRLPDDAKNAMASVAAADYKVTLRDAALDLLGETSLSEAFSEFLNQPVIEISREGKKTTQVIDIRPWILGADAAKNELFLTLKTGSSANLKPETVLESFFSFAGKELPAFSYTIMRLEVYAEADDTGKLCSLNDFGEDIV